MADQHHDQQLAADRLQPAAKRRLADEVYSQLLLQLARRVYAVGERLPTESALVESLNVSRPVVREALMRLQEDGFVRSRQGSGTYLVRLPPLEMSSLGEPGTIAEYIRTYEVRQALETEAARLAARRLQPAAEAELTAAITALERALKEGVYWTEEDLQFHLSVARASGNDFFADQLLHLAAETRGSMDLTLQITRNTSEFARVFEEHQAIYEAILARDEDRARIAMSYHLSRVKMRITASGR